MVESTALVTQDDVDDFHRFATRKLGNGGGELSWDELFFEWQSARARDTENAAIREGLADVDAGRCQAAAEAMEEIRREFGLCESRVD